jgi:hypothetical protein
MVNVMHKYYKFVLYFCSYVKSCLYKRVYYYLLTKIINSLKELIIIIISSLIILIYNYNLYAYNTSLNYKLGLNNLIQDLNYKTKFSFGVNYKLQENNLLCYLQNFDYLLYSDFQVGIDITQLGNDSYILNNHFDVLFINKFYYVTNPYIGIAPALNYYYFADKSNTMTFGFDAIAGSIFELTNDLNGLCEFRFSVTDIGNCRKNVMKFFVGFQNKI